MKGINNIEDKGLLLHHSLSEQVVVGIGASAGGLEAMEDFFRNFPSDSGLSFVVIQHLSPNYKSILADILRKRTSMQVLEAENEVLIRANCVYVIPSTKVMTVRYGKLYLSEKNISHHPNFAVDIFFNSLALNYRDKAIGVILSGAGTDGTKGIEAIKKAGGYVLVQDPQSAKFDGMPNSAVNSGYVDVITRPDLIPGEILRKVRLVPEQDDSVAPDQEHALEKILQLISTHTSYDFNYYKRPTITRRILREVQKKKFDSIQEYHDYLETNTGELENLAKEFLIGVTKFFRDEEAFDILRASVLPEILRNKDASGQIRIWVTGCSTGEEAYSMGILFQDFLEEHGEYADVKIFATDIDKDALEFAGKGLYPPAIEQDLRKKYLDKYFIKEHSYYRANPLLRRMIVFAHHDITKDPPFGRLDMVSCRNMLIYMNPALQKKVIATFRFSLKPGGFMFLGPSESTGELAVNFLDVNKKWKIFRIGEESLKPQNYRDTLPGLSIVHSKNTAKQVKDPSHEMHEMFSEMVFEEYNIAGLLIDRNYDIKNAFGKYTYYLELPEKSLHLNLMKMLPSDISVMITGIVRKATRSKEKLSLKRIRLKRRNKEITFSVTVKPHLQDPAQEVHNFILIFKEERADYSEALQVNENDVEFLNKERILDLENELQETKETLQSSLEEIESANEELQSSNEELISANEELQSTNEELQSLNEELHTVNTEHQNKIKELIELYDDLSNYFRSSRTGQVFLDENLILRKYTPAATELINFIESDIGRPISHISTNIHYPEMLEDMQHVLRTHEPVHKEIETMNGNYFQVNVLSYIRQDRSYAGLVITFFDITNIKRLNNLLTALFNSSISGILAGSAVRSETGEITDIRIVRANTVMKEIFQTEGNITGLMLKKDFGYFFHKNLLDSLMNVVNAGRHFQTEYTITINDKEFCYEVFSVRMEIDSIAITITDITDKKQVEDKISKAYLELRRTQDELKKLNEGLEKRISERTKELEVSEERFRLLTMATADAVWDWNLTSNTMWWNESFNRMVGDHGERSGISSWANRIHPEDKSRVMKRLNDTINKREDQWSEEYRFHRQDNTYAFLLHKSFLVKDEYGTPYRMLSSMIDLSELRKTQEHLKRTNEELVKINADLDNFIYTASHDLKAPIANLEGLLNELHSDMKDGNYDSEFVIGLMKDSVKKFNRTIKDLTDISKIQKNIGEEREVLHIKEVLEHIKTNIRSLILEKNASIYLDCDGSCMEICFSRKNFTSILYNLINNAIKYSFNERRPEVHVNLMREDGYIVLQVKDNGLGMQEDKIPKIFNMFSRLHDHIEGTGVGLYLVKRIVENAGGKIEVESKQGVGTTFRVYFRQE